MMATEWQDLHRGTSETLGGSTFYSVSSPVVLALLQVQLRALTVISGIMGSNQV